MLKESEMRQWASLMLISALRGHMHSRFTEEKINHLRAHYGPEVFEKMLWAVLKEAGRLGPAHSDGSLYLSSVRVKSYVQSHESLEAGASVISEIKQHDPGRGLTPVSAVT